jgi:hypothetical protein
LSEPVSIFSKLFGSRKAAARAEAIRLGIAIDEIERDCPFFLDYNNGTVKIEADWCIKYSVKRQLGRVPPEWSFLQRTQKQGAQYPHGWLFVSVHGAPPASLESVLRKIAHEWNGEFLEFEGTSAEVSAFWEEWGGAKIVLKIYGYLQELARA